MRRLGQDRERGAAAVEFALLGVFVLIPLVFGTLDMARAFRVKIELHNAASNGAFYAISNPCDNAGIESRAHAEWPTGNPSMTVDVVQDGCGSVPREVTVTTTASLDLMVAIIPGVPDPLVVGGHETVEPIGAQPRPAP